MANVKGLACAIGAYILWGSLPVYWKLLKEVPAYEILCHRMVWSLAVTMGLIFLFRRWQTFIDSCLLRRNVLSCSITGVLLGLNWLLYIWAVNSGFVVEASLGYYINPLVNILLGTLLLQEKMRPFQWLAVGIATLGVVYLTLVYGRFPWVGLALAVSFGLYGYLHKRSTMAPLDCLGLETGILFLPALLFLLGLEAQGGGSLSEIDGRGLALLIGTGVVTTVPLLLFGYAVHAVTLGTMGLLQYLAPTISFLLGVFVYQEEFTHSRFIGFCLIWLALAILLVEVAVQRQVVRGRLKRKEAMGEA